MIGSMEDLKYGPKALEDRVLKEFGLDPDNLPTSAINEINKRDEIIRLQNSSKLSTYKQIKLIISQDYSDGKFGKLQKKLLINLAKVYPKVAVRGNILTQIGVKVGEKNDRYINLRGLVRDTRIKINDLKLNNNIGIKKGYHGYLLEVYKPTI